MLEIEPRQVLTRGKELRVHLEGTLELPLGVGGSTLPRQDQPQQVVTASVGAGSEEAAQLALRVIELAGGNQAGDRLELEQRGQLSRGRDRDQQQGGQ